MADPSPHTPHPNGLGNVSPSLLALRQELAFNEHRSRCQDSGHRFSVSNQEFEIYFENGRGYFLKVPSQWAEQTKARREKLGWQHPNRLRLMISQMGLQRLGFIGREVRVHKFAMNIYKEHNVIPLILSDQEVESFGIKLPTVPDESNQVMFPLFFVEYEGEASIELTSLQWEILVEVTYTKARLELA